jgi:hypothetical protein
MRIRDEQIKAFGEQRREAFARRLTIFLREKLPSKTEALPDQELLRRSRRSLAFGLALGLESERDLARLVLYLAELGVDFRASFPPPWVAETLADEALPTKRRLEKILGRVIQSAAPGDVG